MSQLLGLEPLHPQTQLIFLNNLHLKIRRMIYEIAYRPAAIHVIETHNGHPTYMLFSKIYQVARLYLTAIAP